MHMRELACSVGWDGCPAAHGARFWSPICLNPDGPVSLNNASGNETRLMTFVRLWIFVEFCVFFPCLELGVVKRNTTRTMY
jgi:hypothetical protein